MSERDDITEQRFHVPPTRADIQRDASASAMAGLPARLSTSLDNAPAGHLVGAGIMGLNIMQRQVEEFHLAMGQPVVDVAKRLPAERVAVRIELIREEFEDELMPALHAGDLVESADAAIDLLYVVFGLCVEMGINAQVLFDEVHGSNMSKLGVDGKPIIAQEGDPDGTFPGRVKKGPSYYRPRLAQILDSGQADRYPNMGS